MKLALTLVAVLATAGTVTRRTVVLNGDIQRIVIPVDVAGETYICAEYRVKYAKPNRACWDAARVAQKILHDAEPEQCH